MLRGRRSRPLLLLLASYLLSSRDQQAAMQPMAVDHFPENCETWEPAPPLPSVDCSPRISFSCDLDDGADVDQAPRRTDDSRAVDGSTSSSEFNFCVVPCDRSDQESSSAADELFSDGVLLPLFFQRKEGSTQSTSPRPDASPSRNATTASVASRGSTTVVRSQSGCRVFIPMTLITSNKQKKKEASVSQGNGGAVGDSPTVGKQHSSSFWSFRRSSSLNSGGSDEDSPASNRRRSLICSFPLLSRSKSAGSHLVSATAKPLGHHQPSSPSTPPLNTLSSSSGKLSWKGPGSGGSGARNPYYYGQRNHDGAGVRISPVLNMPSPYMPRGSSGTGFLNFGHLLCRVKDRREKPQPPSCNLPPSQYNKQAEQGNGVV